MLFSFSSSQAFLATHLSNAATSLGCLANTSNRSSSLSIYSPGKVHTDEWLHTATGSTSCSCTASLTNAANVRPAAPCGKADEANCALLPTLSSAKRFSAAWRLSTSAFWDEKALWFFMNSFSGCSNSGVFPMWLFWAYSAPGASANNVVKSNANPGTSTLLPSMAYLNASQQTTRTSSRANRWAFRSSSNWATTRTSGSLRRIAKTRCTVVLSSCCFRE
mmetsp:Transcript_2188/g.5103  ORF Transcript_2188/g.5103 Transcript_2188/m.5103 type:complete len:220 (-) Transcript_2188:1331-1990(-)